MTRDVLPYLVAPPGAGSHSGWQRYDNGDWVDLPDALADWDYNTDLQLRATVSVDVDAFLQSTGLGADAPLVWVVSWRAVDSKVGATLDMRWLSAAEIGDLVAFDVTLRGQAIGPIVELRTRLELAGDWPASGPGCATYPGSVLWQQVYTVAVQGDLARFPVAVIDFAASGFDVDASWVLDVPADLSSPVLGGLLLFLNSRDTALITALNTDPDGPLVSGLTEAVGAELLDNAVARTEELLADQWDDGTLGRTLLLLAERAQGGIKELARLRDNQPSGYKALLVGEARRSGLGRSVG